MLMSRVRVAPGAAKNHYELHKLVYSLTSGDPRPLFQYDNQNPYELIVFHTNPLQPVMGTATETKPVVFPKQGATIRFRVDASPSRQVAKTRKRETPQDEAWLEEWFTSRAEKFGIKILSIEVGLNGLRTPSGAVVPVYRYAGTAVVESEELLGQVMRNGFGRGKAFGAGMFLVA